MSLSEESDESTVAAGAARPALPPSQSVFRTFEYDEDVKKSDVKEHSIIDLLSPEVADTSDDEAGPETRAGVEKGAQTKPTTRVTRRRISPYFGEETKSNGDDLPSKPAAKRRKAVLSSSDDEVEARYVERTPANSESNVESANTLSLANYVFRVTRQDGVEVFSSMMDMTNEEIEALCGHLHGYFAQCDLYHAELAAAAAAAVQQEPRQAMGEREETHSETMMTTTTATVVTTRRAAADTEVNLSESESEHVCGTRGNARSNAPPYRSPIPVARTTADDLSLSLLDDDDADNNDDEDNEEERREKVVEQPASKDLLASVSAPLHASVSAPFYASVSVPLPSVCDEDITATNDGDATADVVEDLMDYLECPTCQEKIRPKTDEAMAKHFDVRHDRPSPRRAADLKDYDDDDVVVIGESTPGEQAANAVAKPKADAFQLMMKGGGGTESRTDSTGGGRRSTGSEVEENLVSEAELAWLESYRRENSKIAVQNVRAELEQEQAAALSRAPVSVSHNGGGGGGGGGGGRGQWKSARDNRSNSTSTSTSSNAGRGRGRGRGGRLGSNNRGGRGHGRGRGRSNGGGKSKSRSTKSKRSRSSSAIQPMDGAKKRKGNASLLDEALSAHDSNVFHAGESLNNLLGHRALQENAMSHSSYGEQESFVGY